MDYVISFLEGIVTFISPCLLPMLPVYLLYFTGDKGQEQGGQSHTIRNAAGFVLGFTVVFVLMGAFAGTLGGLLARYQRTVNVVAGLILVLFGLNFAGALQIPLLNQTVRPAIGIRPDRFFSAVLFGMVFSIGWTPCIGTFLGAALMLASSRGTIWKGIGMLLCYSLGLGIPFLLSAVLIDRLKQAFQWIKSHYGIINRVCGVLLVLLGLLMMTGGLNRLLGILRF